MGKSFAVRIVPVIDLMAGQVVRGIAGNRSVYQPIQSPLVENAAPATVAAAFAHLGFGEAYVADLDAIAGQAPDWASYAAIQQAGLSSLYIDAGIGNVDQARAMIDPPVGSPPAAVVCGLESLEGPPSLASIVECLGSERTLFSLDLKAGKPLSRPQAWPDATAEGIAEIAINVGVRRLLVLDLADVGTSAGTRTLPLIEHFGGRFPQLEYWAGGGVRSIDDLRRQEACGVSAVLVASALHDGRIAASEMNDYIPRR